MGGVFVQGGALSCAPAVHRPLPKGWLLRHDRSMRTSYDDIKAYVTKDGSIIRELMHPDAHPVRNQSLAEAVVPPGSRTFSHVHHEAEELYHVTAGTGRMRLGRQIVDIKPGDTVHIAPGTEHDVENTGEGDLRILCCCAPAYSHDDTELTTPSD